MEKVLNMWGNGVSGDGAATMETVLVVILQEENRTELVKGF